MSVRSWVIIPLGDFLLFFLLTTSTALTVAVSLFFLMPTVQIKAKSFKVNGASINSEIRNEKTLILGVKYFALFVTVRVN